MKKILLKLKPIKNHLLIIAAAAVVGCLVYIPQMKGLGYYRDAWNYFYNLTVRGSSVLRQAFNSDRPADGLLISFLYYLFGTNLNGYLIWCLCCRILSSIFFALALLVIWPRTPKMAGFAGVLAVVFPGFLQQVDAITYIPHQTAMLCFMLSFWLTALACKPGQKKWNFLFTFLSMLLTFVSVMLQEYYVGMEIYRIVLIYMLNREQAGDGKPKSFFKSIASYIPYLIPVLGFVGWRIFIFKPERAGTDLIADHIMPLLASPRDEVMKLAVRIVKSIWKLFAGVWTIPAYNLINGLAKKPFLLSLIPSLIIMAAAQLFLFLMHRRKTDETVSAASNESAQWLWFGLICGSVSILPLVIAGRDISFASSLDRFSWPGMIGSILFLIGLLGSLRDRVLRNLLTMAAILLAVFAQWQNGQNYIDQWKMSKDYFQQLLWRAPSLEKGTTVVSGGTLLVEEDYDVFGPIAMAYYPENQNWVPSGSDLPEDMTGPDAHWTPIGAEVLNDGTVRDVILNNRSQRRIREILVDKNYDMLLAITKPSADACLRIIDGRNPIYSTSDWTRIPRIGYRSDLDLIITDPEQQAAIPFFLGEEQEHGWCYYFEKMELALQMSDAETASALADEAAAKDLSAGDPVELIPVIEAYVQTDRMNDAMDAVEQLRTNEIFERSACNYFRGKSDAGSYEEIIDALCGWMPAEDPMTETESAVLEDLAEIELTLMSEPSTAEEDSIVADSITVEEEPAAETLALDEDVSSEVTEAVEQLPAEEMSEQTSESEVTEGTDVPESAPETPASLPG